MKSRRIAPTCLVAVFIASAITMSAFADDEAKNQMTTEVTVWSEAAETTAAQNSHPRTGDEMSLLVWMISGGAIAATATATLAARRKRRHEP